MTATARSLDTVIDPEELTPEQRRGLEPPQLKLLERVNSTRNRHELSEELQPFYAVAAEGAPFIFGIPTIIFVGAPLARWAVEITQSPIAAAPVLLGSLFSLSAMFAYLSLREGYVQERTGEELKKITSQQDYRSTVAQLALNNA